MEYTIKKLKVELLPTNTKVGNITEQWRTNNGEVFTNGYEVALSSEMWLQHIILLESKEPKEDDFVYRGGRIKMAVKKSGSVGYIGHGGHSLLWFKDVEDVVVAHSKVNTGHPSTSDIGNAYAARNNMKYVVVLCDKSGNLILSGNDVVYTEYKESFSRNDFVEFLHNTPNTHFYMTSEEDILKAMDEFFHKEKLINQIEELNEKE